VKDLESEEFELTTAVGESTLEVAVGETWRKLGPTIMRHYKRLKGLTFFRLGQIVADSYEFHIEGE